MPYLVGTKPPPGRHDHDTAKIALCRHDFTIILCLFRSHVRLKTPTYWLALPADSFHLLLSPPCTKKRTVCTMHFDLILLYHGGSWTFKDIFPAPEAVAKLHKQKLYILCIYTKYTQLTIFFDFPFDIIPIRVYNIIKIKQTTQPPRVYGEKGNNYE